MVLGYVRFDDVRLGQTVCRFGDVRLVQVRLVQVRCGDVRLQVRSALGLPGAQLILTILYIADFFCRILIASFDISDDTAGHQIMGIGVSVFVTLLLVVFVFCLVCIVAIVVCVCKRSPPTNQGVPMVANNSMILQPVTYNSKRVSNTSLINFSTLIFQEIFAFTC